ncbi:MAG: hypothetical protein QOJ54_1796 [Aliidongia sp.]|jgi:hypothetical protein|nr:hypothetical protein [Aliidongia sp.]
MKILVIPEDFRKDQYLLKPLFTRLFQSFGRQNVIVQVCQNPLLGGIGEALKSERIAEIIKRYRGMVDLFILCVDRDGILGRRQRLEAIEKTFGTDQKFFAENAWEELETWTLAGLDLPDDWRWADVRAAVSVKEQYFDVLAKQRGVADGPGYGRKSLGEEAARRVNVIRRKCPEDFDELAKRCQDAF